MLDEIFTAKQRFLTYMNHFMECVYYCILCGMVFGRCCIMFMWRWYAFDLRV